jgi:heme/copper-type cytochrome/quinol oxidase subunit 2
VASPEVGGSQGAHFHESTVVEIVWTVIPFLILLFMAFPATKTILAMKDTSAPGLTIKVTGNQWSWAYDYLQEGFGYYSTFPRRRRRSRTARPRASITCWKSTVRSSCRRHEGASLLTASDVLTRGGCRRSA